MKTDPEITIFESRDALQDAASANIISSLAEALAGRGAASFFGAGGSTPGPIYEHLSKAALDWRAITIGLTDERWVDETHSGSNAALMRATLLQGTAQGAVFLPMKTEHADPFEAVPALAQTYAKAEFADMILLGMGPDAHTLSWFPGAKGLETALDSGGASPVAAIEAVPSKVTGDNLLRMTLTLPCIAKARAVILAITGEEKLAVFKTAGDETPVKRMASAAGKALKVFYAD